MGLFNMLRLVLCTQPRSNPITFRFPRASSPSLLASASIAFRRDESARTVA
jgi:hypothetical protein